MRALIIMGLLLLAISQTHAQLNVELLHQLVQHSKDEYNRQQTARNRQALPSANEEVNRSNMGDLKQKYRTLPSRFQTIGLAIHAPQIGCPAPPITRESVTSGRDA